MRRSNTGTTCAANSAFEVLAALDGGNALQPMGALAIDATHVAVRLACPQGWHAVARGFDSPTLIRLACKLDTTPTYETIDGCASGWHSLTGFHDLGTLQTCETNRGRSTYSGPTCKGPNPGWEFLACEFGCPAGFEAVARGGSFATDAFDDAEDVHHAAQPLWPCNHTAYCTLSGILGTHCRTPGPCVEATASAPEIPGGMNDRMGDCGQPGEPGTTYVGTLELSVDLDAPAPAGGTRFVVVSDDPHVTATDVVVPAGETHGVGTLSLMASLTNYTVTLRVYAASDAAQSAPIAVFTLDATTGLSGPPGPPC